VTVAEREGSVETRAAEWGKQLALRRRIQLAIWVIVVIVIVGGLWFPLLGFVVPVVMLTGIVGGFFRGRYVCGWLCPRGAFLDRILRPISPVREIPAWLRGHVLRWVIFGLLMGFMVWQISLNPGDVQHWGKVFVRICIITTGIGVVLAIFVHPRTWCSFCPMGTMQSAVGGSRAPLKMDEGCVECRSCERACPMNLKIVGQEKDGALRLPDCLKCGECVVVCPKNVLHF
jgi:ferredoxin-type protein NapH